MSQIETATHRASQPADTAFQAKIRNVWGVWVRMLNRDHLKGVFSREEDARGFAKHAAGPQHLAEVRSIRVLLNLDAREAYLLGDPADPLIAVDVDFQHKMRQEDLRAKALARLSPEELAALGLQQRAP